MGYGYNVYPLKAALNSPTVRRRLDEVGLIYPASVTEGRYPSFDEILAVAQSIPGYRVDNSHRAIDWHISIEEDVPLRDGKSVGGWVILETSDYGDEITQPDGFWVYRGCEQAIVLVMSYLAGIYGPFVVEDELGDACILVTSETAPEAEWTIAERTEEEEP